ncbi:MAG: ABC1 kinase family protein [Bdellovibrionales bacterium]
MAKSPPKTSLARSKVIGKVAGRVASKKISSGVKSVFLKPEDKQTLRQRTNLEIAQMIFEGLSQLRGTALKLAQLFCGETGLLPEEYMKVFEQAQYKVSPLSAALVRTVLRRELGQDPLLVFAEFEADALAAASLGQVHRAKLKNGTWVAVKVQYPGMNESIVNDFALARKLLKPFANTGLLINILDELQDRLRQEVDYMVEQEHSNWFRAQTLPPTMFIPQVHADLTCPTVLTMDFVSGQHLDQWLLSHPSQDRIDKVANTLFSFFTRSVFQWQRLHVDPNLGNFLITEDDRIAVIDFGAVKIIPQEDVTFYTQLWRTSKGDDRTPLLEQYEKRGMQVAPGGVEQNRQLLEQAVEPYLDWIQTLLAQESFDFKTQPDFVRRGHEIFSQQLFNPQLQNFSTGLTLVHRTLLGLGVVFQRLGAKLHVDSHRHTWQKSY